MVITLNQEQSAHFDTPGGNTTTLLASSQVGAKQLFAIHQAQLPGGTNPMHAKSSEALVVVLGGTVDVVTGTETFSLREGDAALVSPGTTHQLRNAGTAVARWLVITPADVEFTTPEGQPIEPVWARS
jgi:quercetin dioxygenase-like cupin family protein